MKNDYYVKRGKKVLYRTAPHQKPPRMRNNKKDPTLDINSKYLESTYIFIKWTINLFIEDCKDVIKIWIVLYALALVCKYFL